MIRAYRSWRSRRVWRSALRKLAVMRTIREAFQWTP